MFPFFYFFFLIFLLRRLPFRLPFLSLFDLTSYIDSFSQYSILYVFLTQYKKHFISWREVLSLRPRALNLNPLNPELNSICYLLALLGAHHSLHVSRIRVKLLTFRRLMSYIYMEHPFLMFLDHTQRRSTVGRTPLDE